jgi:hypothetical protein
VILKELDLGRNRRLCDAEFLGCKSIILASRGMVEHPELVEVDHGQNLLPKNFLWIEIPHK